MKLQSLTLLLLLSLASCYKTAEPEDSGDPGNLDSDGDSYSEPQDCNDNDASVHPNAPELCNLVDDDCNGFVDDDPIDASSWYLDADEDGHAGSEISIQACDAPYGYYESSEDCDDTNAEVHPGAPETCNERDDDCNGVEDDDPISAPTWWMDEDGDGYGGPKHSMVTCSPYPSYVDNSSDCDDHDAEIHPHAIELCDHIDQDCDFVPDDWAADAPTWHADLDGDSFGGETETLIQCEEPKGYLREGGDCDDSEPTVHPGAEERCDGLDNDCDGLYEDALVVPGLYPTLDEAIEASDAGDLICVAPGLYAWASVVRDQEIIIQGASAERTVFDLSGTSGIDDDLSVTLRSVTLQGETDYVFRGYGTRYLQDVTIQDATLRNIDLGGSLDCEDLRIQSSSLQRLFSDGDWVQGLEMDSSIVVGSLYTALWDLNEISDLSLTNNRFESTVFALDAGSLSIEGLSMSGNVVEAETLQGGLASVLMGGVFTCQRCDLRDNTFQANEILGGLTYGLEDGRVLLENVIVAGNTIEATENLEGGLFHLTCPWLFGEYYAPTYLDLRWADLYRNTFSAPTLVGAVGYVESCPSTLIDLSMDMVNIVDQRFGTDTVVSGRVQTS